MRRSKREIARDVASLGPEDDEKAPVMALEREDGSYVDSEGNPIHNPSACVFSVPADIWQEWGPDVVPRPEEQGGRDAS